MEFSDLPRRQHPPRYPAPADYEDGYWAAEDTGVRPGNGSGYRGGLVGAPPRRLPRDGDPSPASPRSTGARPAGTFASPRNAGTPGRTAGTFARDTGGLPRNTGGLPRNTGAFARDTGTFARDTGTFSAAGDHAAARPADARAPARGAHSRPRRRRQRRRGGLLTGAITGFLAAAVSLGVANLAAAFVRPQASPIIAVGGAFIDRTPPALKNFAVEKFGENDKNVLLLGMYVTVALMAILLGMLAWRRLAAGVAGIGLFGLFGAFVAITRPESHATDVIPTIAGAIAGVAAIIWLVRAGTRRAGYRSPAQERTAHSIRIGWTE